jgi:hypothetical protein
MQNLKTSTLIRNGLKHLWDGKDHSQVPTDEKEEYLCHAIVRAARGGQSRWMSFIHRGTSEMEGRVQDVRDMIEKRLFPYNNLAAWLAHCGGVRQSEMTPENLQKHRRKWALKMAAEFKRKGD